MLTPNDALQPGQPIGLKQVLMLADGLPEDHRNCFKSDMLQPMTGIIHDAVEICKLHAHKPRDRRRAV